MNQPTRHSRRPARAVLLGLILGLAGPGANAAVDVLGVQYQQDKLHPEFDCIFDNSRYPDSCTPVTAGANVHVYLRNSGASRVMVTNLTLAGHSLKTILKRKAQGKNDPYSIFYYWDKPPQAIFDAGEPVWYRTDPTNLPPGAVFQVVVRLRQVPVTRPVRLGVQTDDGLTATASIPVDANAPQLASVGFSPNLDKVYLHWRRNGGAAPAKINMDGIDVTPSATTVGDTSVNFAASVLTLSAPLTHMSYHVFQGVYGDGETATASLRAWVNRFNYGTYGAAPTQNWDDARAWINSCEDRGVNCLIWNNGSAGLTGFLNKPAGQTYAAEHGYRFIVDGPRKWNTADPLAWYLRDEPDAHDAHLARSDRQPYQLPQDNKHSVGALAMREIAKGDDLHYRQGKATPTIVNVDATFMPYNYFTYGQVADIGMTDPYYNSRQKSAYWGEKKNIPLYHKATYIYAVAQAMTEAAEPNPTLVALCSTGTLVETKDRWVYMTPECVRMQAYYAVAAGAKNMGYWWMLGKSAFGANIVAGEPTCTALWNGIGLVGNEFKTAAPLIVTSHPVTMTLAPSTNIWARALVSGVDSLLLFVANDCYTNDIKGFHYTPISNATVTATLPLWLRSAPAAFEISAAGLRDVGTALNGSQLQINLGTVQVTRLIVVTTNAQLRSTVQTRYDTQVRPHVARFAPELFRND